MLPAISRTSAEPTLYEILSLTPKRLEGQALAAQQKAIKQAYHKALLKHHPDKSSSTPPLASSNQQPRPGSSGKYSPPLFSSSSSSSSVPKSQVIYTVDQIQHAYGVLSNARQRQEYDRQLLLAAVATTSASSSAFAASSPSAAEQRHSVSTRFHTGVETVDLDDLGFDERTGVYFGPCRCGNARGFQFAEAQLEEHEDDLVLMVQCLDCSLWMRVLFDAAEDSEDDRQQQQQQQKYPQSRSDLGHMQADSAGTGHTVVANQNQGATERRSSHSVSRSGSGWKFNISFDWGISMAGSVSSATSASRGTRT
ncbi:putative diphthamide biosynthesis protein 4 [Rosellinia necatrix]|uniref:Diphthamide biosynthesis protein 4 n=1 Tax=Rosellinia necatrix TaxID=77044 RepID=A0A1W2TDG9_ROSNE|nr:putative diphthamide biosynthesis protein 4 [Rosellinia necatrix]